MTCIKFILTTDSFPLFLFLSEFRFKVLNLRYVSTQMQNTQFILTNEIEKWMQPETRKCHFLKRRMSHDIFVVIIFIATSPPCFDSCHKAPQQLSERQVAGKGTV